MGPVTEVEEYALYECPAYFNKYGATGVFPLEKGKITVNDLFPTTENIELGEACGAYISWDTAGKIIYIGASEPAKVDRAKTKLANLLRYLVSDAESSVSWSKPNTVGQEMKPIQAKHLIYPEDDINRTVDARYMAHVNPNLVNSTLIDPYSVSGLAEFIARYEALYSKAFTLRICIFDSDKNMTRSFFGPRAPAVFNGTGHRWFQPFHPFHFPIKQRHVETLRKQQTATAEDDELKGFIDNIGAWREGVVNAAETGNLEIPDRTPIDTDVETSRQKVQESLSSLNRVTQALEVELENEDEKDPGSIAPPLAERLAQQDQFNQAALARRNNVLQNQLPHETRHRSSHGADGQGTRQGLNSLLAFSPQPARAIGNGTQPLVPTIQHDDEASTRQFHTTMRQKASPRKLSTQPAADPTCTQSASQEFDLELGQHLTNLVNPLRIKIGEIQLRAEFGRICLLDDMRQGMAFNKPEDRSNGWTFSSLVKRLDQGCPVGKVHFTKIFSIFGNDAERLFAMKDEAGNQLWKEPEKLVFYEFTCRRTFVDETGRPCGHDTFIVEINGSHANHFSFEIRRPEDHGTPVWLHCVHRHWDIRFVAVHTPSHKLRKIYGDYAQTLLDSLVVP